MWKKFCAALLLMLLLPACALAEVVISEIMTSNGTYENGHAYDTTRANPPSISAAGI